MRPVVALAVAPLPACRCVGAVVEAAVLRPAIRRKSRRRLKACQRARIAAARARSALKTGHRASTPPKLSTPAVKGPYGKSLHWNSSNPVLTDPRLPDPALASRRVYGDLRPSVNLPHAAPQLAVGYIGGKLYRVHTNRVRKRWWLVVLTAPTSEWERISDYVTTTSERKARGWIDAINEAAAELTTATTTEG